MDPVKFVSDPATDFHRLLTSQSDKQIRSCGIVGPSGLATRRDSRDGCSLNRYHIAAPQPNAPEQLGKLPPGLRSRDFIVSVSIAPHQPEYSPGSETYHHSHALTFPIGIEIICLWRKGLKAEYRLER